MLREVKGFKSKLFYPVMFASMMLTSTGMAKISPLAFKNVAKHFKKGQYNPELGEIALNTGIIEDLRFFGAYTPGISNNNRNYAIDKSDDPTWNVCKILFPSTGGNLTSSSNASSDFGRYVSNPVVVAKLLEFADAVREGTVVEKPPRAKKNEIQKRSFDSYKDELVKLMDADGSEQKKTVSNLLRQIVASIKNEGEIYPKFFTEQIIEAFFCHKFDTRNDLEKMVNALPDTIIDKKVKWDDDANFNLSYLKTISGKKENLDFEDLYGLGLYKNLISPLPYSDKDNPISNASTYPYDRESDKIIKGAFTFADCVEVSWRHIFNMALYDIDNSNFNLEGIKKRQSNFQEDSLSYKKLQNLLDFYATQKPALANGGSTRLRSLWNRVVGDLNFGKSKNKVIYMKENKTELDTGMINMAYVITSLMSFDDLEKEGPALNNNNNGGYDMTDSIDWVEKVFNKFFEIIAPHRKIQTTFHAQNGNADLIGNIDISAFDLEQNKLFSVDVNISDEHTYVNKPSLKTIEEDPLEEDKMKQAVKKTVFPPQSTEESVFLLHGKELNDKLTSPIYKIFNSALDDNDSKLEALRQLSMAWNPNTSKWCASIADKIIDKISWDDNYVRKEATKILVVLKASDKLNDDFRKKITSKINELNFGTINKNWFDNFTEANPQITPEKIDEAINHVLGYYSHQTHLTLSKFSNKTSLPILENIKTLILHLYHETKSFSLAQSNEKIEDLRIFVDNNSSTLNLSLENIPSLRGLILRGMSDNKMRLNNFDINNVKALQSFKLTNISLDNLVISDGRLALEKAEALNSEFKNVHIGNNLDLSFNLIECWIDKLNAGNDLSKLTIDKSSVNNVNKSVHAITSTKLYLSKNTVDSEKKQEILQLSPTDRLSCVFFKTIINESEKMDYVFQALSQDTKGVTKWLWDNCGKFNKYNNWNDISLIRKVCQTLVELSLDKKLSLNTMDFFAKNIFTDGDLTFDNLNQNWFDNKKKAMPDLTGEQVDQTIEGIIDSFKDYGLSWVNFNKFSDKPTLLETPIQSLDVNFVNGAGKLRLIDNKNQPLQDSSIKLLTVNSLETGGDYLDIDMGQFQGAKNIMIAGKYSSNSSKTSLGVENLDNISCGVNLEIKNVVTADALNFNNSNLQSFLVFDSELNGLKFESETKLNVLSLKYSKIDFIDLEGAKNLTKIDVERSEVDKMSDVTNFQHLIRLHILDNSKLPDLNISDLKSLETFELYNNVGSHTIDLSTSDDLMSVNAKDTKMKSLILQERMRNKAVYVTDEMVEKREWIQPSKTGPSGKEED